MIRMRKHLCQQLFFSGIALALFVYFIFLRDYLIAGFFCLSTALCIVFLIRRYRDYTAAKRIIENQIFTVCPVQICQTKSEENFPHCEEALECILSPFGILFGEQVCKFGYDNIRLYALEISRTSITIEFGSRKKSQKAVFLHEKLEQHEISQLVGKIEFEMGIKPKLVL